MFGIGKMSSFLVTFGFSVKDKVEIRLRGGQRFEKMAEDLEIRVWGSSSPEKCRYCRIKSPFEVGGHDFSSPSNIRLFCEVLEKMRPCMARTVDVVCLTHIPISGVLSLTENSGTLKMISGTPRRLRRELNVELSEVCREGREYRSRSSEFL